MEYQTILLDIDRKSRIATVTLNRPEDYNRLNRTMNNEIIDVVRVLSKDEDVRVIVFNGAGKNFCAGMATEGMVDQTIWQHRKEVQESRVMRDELFACPKATIFAIHGLAMAGGAATTLCGDVSFMAEDAKLAFSAINIGIACVRTFITLRGLVGTKVATELVLTGRMISAQEAKEMHLVNYVVPKEELEGAVMEEARLIASKSPLGVEITKRVKALSVDMSPNDAETWTCDLGAILACSEEGQEGMRAFMEKRAPKWQI